MMKTVFWESTMMRSGLKYAADEVVIGTTGGLQVRYVTKADLCDAHSFLLLVWYSRWYHLKGNDRLRAFRIILESSACD